MKKFIMKTIGIVIILQAVMCAEALAISVPAIETNGYLVSFPDAQPYIDENNRTMVPIRFIAESLCCDISWDDEKQIVSIKKDLTTINIGINDYNIIIFKDGQIATVTMDTLTQVKNDRVYVPIRFVSQALGASIYFDNNTNTVKIQQESIDEQKNITEFKAEILKLVNAERAANGLKALVEMSELNAPADMRAYESSISFSHTRPDGRSCSTTFSDNKLKYKSAGENLAYGYDDAESTVKAWMASKGHRANILSDKFVYAGIGYYQGKDGTVYCSQLFYTP